MLATNQPSCVIEGMGIAQQAKYSLSAIVGNIDVEGGEELLGPALIGCLRNSGKNC